MFYYFEEEQFVTALKTTGGATMGDLTADNNQTPAKERKESIFDSFKFWGAGPRNRKSLSKDIEISPIKIEEEEEIVHPPKKSSNTSGHNNVKLYDTISGNHIISRGWDGNNMGVFKIRRKN